MNEFGKTKTEREKLDRREIKRVRWNQRKSAGRDFLFRIKRMWQVRHQLWYVQMHWDYLTNDLKKIFS